MMLSKCITNDNDLQLYNQKSMKILMLTQNFPPIGGGIAVFLHNICLELQLRGHKIEVLASSKAGDRETDAKQPYLVQRYRNLPRLSSLIPICKTILHCFRKGTDLLFLGLFTSTHSLGAVLAHKFLHIPYVILVHGYDLNTCLTRSKVDQWTSHLVLDNASLVLVNSSFTRQQVEDLGYLINRICVINPGVDTQSFHPDLDSSSIKRKYHLANKPVLLTSARLEPEKNIRLVLEALPEVVDKFPNLVYLIVGEGTEESMLKEMTRKLNLENNVIFIGYIEYANIQLYYAVCDVYVMTGHRESFGVAYAEASACGKPVVGSRVGGVADVVVDGVTGLLVDPDDNDELALAIIRLLMDREYAQMLGMNGRRRMEQEFGWQQVGEKLEISLRQVVGE